MNQFLPRTYRCLLVCLATALAGSRPATAQQAKPAFVNGEYLISVTRGTSPADVATIAGKANASVVSKLGSFDATTDTYYLRANDKPDAAKSLAAVNTLKTADARVRFAGVNGLDYPTQTGATTAVPNDPRYNEQWDKVFLRLPEAWTIEKGKGNVVIVVIDTGCDIDHPDIKSLGSRLLQGYNSMTKTNDPREVGTPSSGFYGHGTHVSGIATAMTNNGVGVAGCAWENVKLLPISAIDPASGGFSGASLIEAINFVINHQTANPNNKYVVNMSIGGARPSDTPDLTDPLNAALLAAAKKGIVFTISAGNSGDAGNPPTGPAYMASQHQNILCVASSNHLGQRSYYSSFRPYTTIAAPGGDDRAGKLILSTYPTNAGSYALEQGTSMAAPNAAGVISLILSVPSVNPGDIRSIVTSTARPQPGATLPTPELGYGIIDAFAALKKVAISVTVLEPTGTGGKSSTNGTIPDPVETIRPAIRIQALQITPDQLSITIDGNPIARCDAPGQTALDPGGATPCYSVEKVTATTTVNNNSVPLSYEAVIRNLDLSPGQHTIVVIGTRPADTTGGTPTVVTDTRTVTVQPHIIPAGRSMISFPYYQYVNLSGSVTSDPHDPGQPNNITPQVYLGTNFRLARWLTAEERYAFYSSFGQSDNAASFTPGDVLPHLDGDPATPAYAKWPVGLGFWADVETGKPILTKGQAITDRAFVIPLKADPNVGDNGVSWNMIGDPFPFDVPFNSLLVDTPTGRISISEAANRGYILPNVYTYDGAAGYTFQTLPAGALRAWTGHWVGLTSKVDLNLVVPPAKISRAATVVTRAATSTNGWLVQLSAHARNLHDTYNFLGVSSNSNDGYDRLDVQKPPMSGPFVSLGVQNSTWSKRPGVYAQDVRSTGGTKTWTIVSTTDQPNTDVTINWNTATLPKGVRLTLKDDASGQTYDMRSRASLTYNSGSTPAPRTFTVSSGQSTGRGVRIANLNVRPTNRATGASVIGFSLTGDATYEVRIISGAGNTVSNVATRAAAASGDVSVVWNGRDNSGKAVAAGTYLVQIRATTNDGESVRAIQPFTIVR